MPDISEGLSTEESISFEDALAAKFGSSDPMSQGTPNEPAEEPSAPARDPETGQFTPAATETSDAETVEDPVDPADAAVAAYLAKYGGDQGAALKAAADAQSVIGRQGQELGQTREALARMQGQIDAMLAQQSATPAGPALSADQVEERVVELSTTVGYPQAAMQLANESLQGDTRTYDALLRNWVLEDPIGAQRFDLDFQLWKRDQSATPAAPDPRLTQVIDQTEVTAMADAIGVVASERGDSWASIAPHMDAALEGVHPSVLELVASGNAEDRLAGTRMIADRAFTLATQAAPLAQSAAEIAAAQAVARKVAGSAVATGSLRPAEVPAGSPESRQEAIKSFKDQFLATETTNIADGLTFGK